MYVTQRSFAAPAPKIRDFFWLYHTYSLLRGGFYNASSGFGLWAKTLRGQLKPQQVSEAFNKHFARIGPRLAGEIHADTNDFSYTDFLSDPALTSVFNFNQLITIEYVFSYPNYALQRRQDST